MLCKKKFSKKYQKAKLFANRLNSKYAYHLYIIPFTQVHRHFLPSCHDLLFYDCFYACGDLIAVSIHQSPKKITSKIPNGFLKQAENFPNAFILSLPSGIILKRRDNSYLSQWTIISLFPDIIIIAGGHHSQLLQVNYSPY